MTSARSATCLCAAIGTLLAFAPTAHAATATASISVSAIVAPLCQAGTLPSEPQPILSVACSRSQPYTVSLDDGAGAVATVARDPRLDARRQAIQALVGRSGTGVAIATDRSASPSHFARIDSGADTIVATVTY